MGCGFHSSHRQIVNLWNKPESETPYLRFVNVSLAGSGDVNVDSTVHDLEAEIAGSGTIHVAQVTGDLRQDTFGSGRVIVGH